MMRSTIALCLLLVISFSVRSQLVISEIMYNPPESNVDSLEFIEIYNAGSTPVDMNGYSIWFAGTVRDAITTSVIVPPGGFLVTAVDSAAVRRQYNLSFKPRQWSTTGLNNTSTKIILKNGNIGVDSVTYNDSWQPLTDGLGRSLILCDPASNNELAASWYYSAASTGNIINNQMLYGSPGVLEACPCTVTSTQEVSACDSFDSPSGLYTWTESGEFRDTIPSVGGCDSVITFLLTVNYSAEFEQTVELCAGESVSVGNSVYDSEGIFEDLVETIHGCDSLITTTIIVHEPATYTQELEICFGDVVVVGSSIYDEEGTYEDVLNTVHGCDSTVITILSVLPEINATIIQSGDILSAGEVDADYQWLYCTKGFELVDGETDRTFEVTESGTYAVLISVGECSATSECVDVIIGSVNDLLDGGTLAIYPNPNNGVFRVESDKRGELIISDLTGRVVMRRNYNGNQLIQFDESMSGVFVVQFVTEGRVLTQRMVVSE